MAGVGIGPRSGAGSGDRPDDPASNPWGIVNAIILRANNGPTPAMSRPTTLVRLPERLRQALDRPGGTVPGGAEPVRINAPGLHDAVAHAW